MQEPVPPSTGCPHACSVGVCGFFARGFQAWLADLCADLPAAYEIEYVRVYQRKGHTRIGCNPKDFPTEGWIQSHEADFTSAFHPELLRYVFAGGAACSTDADCGTFGGVARGACTATGLCECSGVWTGPKCRSRRTSHSLTCRPLEDAVLGGGQCLTTDSRACGFGKCVKILRDPWAPSAETQLSDGTWTRLGGGDGRCACDPGYGGPYCTRATTPQCLANPFPPHFETGLGLQKWITELCGQQQLGPALAVACAEVEWTPHWISGDGQYSMCGAWLRATWVGAASCEDLQGGTCADGVQGGDETGVDCGGAHCPPCPAVCDTSYAPTSECGDKMRWVAANRASVPAVDGAPCSIQSYLYSSEGACPQCSCPRATSQAAAPEVCAAVV